MESNEKYPTALPQGTVLAGQYVIGHVLGQGGFGITYKATDNKTGENVAVKEFFPNSMAARTTATTVSAYSGSCGENFAYGKDCFLQEAETLAQFIGDEHIVRVFSYFEENGTAYFVMEYIEGTSFDQYIKECGGKLPYEEAEQILLTVIDALAAVHAKGIVHRDVTPDNIYITKDGTVKLLDFGAARYSLGDQSRSLDVVLKHGYAPKEQYTRHGKQGPFTDVYSVGASFYFAVTGKRPPDSIDRMDEDELIPPSSLGKIAPEKEDAILKAMSVQPSERYQTMAEFRQALMGASDDRTVMLMQDTAQTTSQPVQQRVFSEPQPQPVQQRVFTEPRPQPVKVEETSTENTQLLYMPEKDMDGEKPQKNSLWQKFSAKQKALCAVAALTLVVAISVVAVMLTLPKRSNENHEDGTPTLSGGEDVASVGKFPSTENKGEQSSGTEPKNDTDERFFPSTENREEQSSETEPKHDADEGNFPSTENREDQSGNSESKTEQSKTDTTSHESEISFPLVIRHENLIYDCYSDGTATLTDGNKAAGAVSIPSTINYGSRSFRVTSIGEEAFADCSNLTSIEIPKGVTSIEDDVFWECSNLTSIKIPESVVRIGASAFAGCENLTSIEIPKGVTSIEEDAFWLCENLTSINIPKGVESIGYGAFRACYNLTSIEIPEGVTSIGAYAFESCSKLKSIGIPESVTSIGKGAFMDCSNLTSIEIPEGVTCIEDDMFYGCSSLWDIGIPESVTSIGAYAFAYCSKLTYIWIPGEVKSVGGKAFTGCKNWMTISYGGRTMSKEEFRALF